MERTLVAVPTAVGLAGALAAPAQADNDSYLDYLRNHGQVVLPWMEGSWLTSGQMVCMQLR